MVSFQLLRSTNFGFIAKYLHQGGPSCQPLQNHYYDYLYSVMFADTFFLHTNGCLVYSLPSKLTLTLDIHSDLTLFKNYSATAFVALLHC